MKFKSIFMVIALLGLGFTMGMLTSGRLMHKKVTKMAKTRTAEGLEERIFSIVQAEESQKENLRNIIRPYSLEFEKIRKENMASRRLVLDSMQVKVENELSDEQTERFREFIKKMKRPGMPHKKFKKEGKRPD